MAEAFIEIGIEDREVLDAFNRLMRLGADPAPALREIGEVVTEQTKRRIEAGGPAPSGAPWAPLSEVTRARKGETDDRILIWHGYLLGDIHYQLDAEGVAIGTSRKYGAAMQFGMPKGYAGETARGAPIPWGNIPPRPFLGLSDSDSEAVLAIINRYLRAAL